MSSNVYTWGKNTTAEKNSWVVETRTHIEAGLIDLPINYTLHLPKKISPFAYHPNSLAQKKKHITTSRPCGCQNTVSSNPHHR